MNEQPASRALNFGWAPTALLLLVISMLPFYIPAASTTPGATKPLMARSTARKHTRLVLFIVDGLGTRKALQKGMMPFFQDRIKKSAFGVAEASFPTITPPGLRSIMSGHQMSVIEPEVPGAVKSSAEDDSVLARASAARLRAVVFGQYNWEPLFAGHGARLNIVPYTGLVVKHDHGYKELYFDLDKKLLDMAWPILNGKDGKWDFLVVHLFEVDPIAHAFGTEDELYRTHLRWVDQKIEEVSKQLAAQEPTTFMMVADHGQNADGTHGGTTASVTDVPFMLWGAGIKTKKLPRHPLYDAAPTIAALLGVMPPILSQGWPLLDAFDVPDKAKVEMLRDLLKQRQARWEAVAAVWPWVRGNPAKAIEDVDRLIASGQYSKALKIERKYVAGVDAEMQAVLPKSWLSRIIASIWILLGAAAFGLAWPRTGNMEGRMILAASAVAALLFVAPFLFPQFWFICATAALTVSIALLLLGLKVGHGSMDGPGWGVALTWLILSIGISFPDIVDIGLWAWLVVMNLIFTQWRRFSRAMLVPVLLTSLGTAACFLLAWSKPSTEVSLARSLCAGVLPPFHFEPPWESLQYVFPLIFAAAAARRFIFHPESRNGWVVFLCAAVPLFLSLGVSRVRPADVSLVWWACAAALAVVSRINPEPRVRGLCMSLVALAFYRTMSDPPAWCMLAVTSLVGWGLAWKAVDRHPMFEGMALLGVGLWSYSLTGGEMSFSRIVVTEGFRAMGAPWSPHQLATVVTLKYLVSFATPVLPFLVSRPLRSVLAMMPLLGGFCAGSITMVWWDRFMVGGYTNLTDHAGYSRALFGMVIMWSWLFLWGIGRGADLATRALSMISIPPELWSRLKVKLRYSPN